MLKKIQLTLLIFFTTTSSYAYEIGANLTIENKTNTPMIIAIDNPNGQAPTTSPIPAHKTSLIYLKNGDNSGWLYQKAIAPFIIKDATENNKIYIKGRLVYYVGNAAWVKHSFLNAVTASDDLTVDVHYTCKNGGYSAVLDNQIIISGTPQNALSDKPFPTDLFCRGLKSSTLRGSQNDFYTPICFDNDHTRSSSIFWRKKSENIEDGQNLWEHVYTNGEEYYHLLSVNPVENVDLFQAALNRQVGDPYCETFYL